jgi:hypothetical protein
MKLPNNLSADLDWSPIDSSTIDLSDSYTIDNNMTQTWPSMVYTSDTIMSSGISGSMLQSNEFTNSTITINTNGIEMQPGTDIVIGGQSLMKTLDVINERLAILQPNTQLESEWEELKELGERYREMEQDLLEKARVWGILKAPAKR